jgi:hypothetical protein
VLTRGACVLIFSYHSKKIVVVKAKTVVYLSTIKDKGNGRCEKMKKMFFASIAGWLGFLVYIFIFIKLEYYISDYFSLSLSYSYLSKYSPLRIFFFITSAAIMGLLYDYTNMDDKSNAIIRGIVAVVTSSFFCLFLWGPFIIIVGMDMFSNILNIYGEIFGYKNNMKDIPYFFMIFFVAYLTLVYSILPFINKYLFNKK